MNTNDQTILVMIDSLPTVYQQAVYALLVEENPRPLLLLCDEKREQLQDLIKALGIDSLQ